MKKLFLLILITTMFSVSFAGETVIVYIPSSMTYLQKEVGMDFHQKTGVRVKFIGIKGIPARLKLEKRNPKADVVLGLSNVNVMEAKENKLIISYKPKTSHKIIHYKYNLDDEWYSTPFDYGALAINTNMNLVKKLPTSFNDLKNMKKKLIVPSPYSFTGQEFLMWTIAIYGDKWQDFWRELKPSIKTVVPGWSEEWAKFTANEVPFIVGYATSDLYFKKNSVYKSFIPKEGAYVYVQGASIVAKNKIKNGAKLFIDYILENKFQQVMMDSNYMFPVTGIQLTKAYNRLPKITKVVTLKKSDLKKMKQYKKELIKILRK